MLQKTISRLKTQMKGFFDEAPIAFGILRNRNLRIEVANRLILQVWGRTDAVIGQDLGVAIPELEGQPYLKILDNIFLTGERFIGKELKVSLERDGITGAAHFNFIYEPIKSKNGKVQGIMILANEVTELVNSRDEYRSWFDNSFGKVKVIMHFLIDKPSNNDYIIDSIRINLP